MAVKEILKSRSTKRKSSPKRLISEARLDKALCELGYIAHVARQGEWLLQRVPNSRHRTRRCADALTTILAILKMRLGTIYQSRLTVAQKRTSDALYDDYEAFRNEIRRARRRASRARCQAVIITPVIPLFEQAQN